MGKKVASAAVSVGVGAAFNGVGKITETVNAAGKTVKEVATGGISKMLAGSLGDGFGQVALNAGLAGLQTYTSVVASSFVGAIGSDDYWGTVGEAAWSTDTLANVMSAGAGSLAGGILNKLNLGDKLEKVLGFNAGQIGEMQQFNAFAGSLARAGLGYAISGEMTLNVLNLKDLSGGALGPMGLLEMRIGGEDGFSMGMGTGGTDISFGTVATAMAGLGHWGMNIDIEAAAKRNMSTAVATETQRMLGIGDEEARQTATGNLAVAMRGAYGFGDGTDLAQLDSILRGGDGIAGRGHRRRRTDNNGWRDAVCDTERDEGGGDKRAAAFAFADAVARGAAGRDSRREQGGDPAGGEGAYGDGVEMLGDAATSSVMKGVIDASENLQMDLGKYMTAKAKGDDGIFADYVDETYDSSADYWKLVKTKSGDYDFQWDGNLNIYDENGKKLMDYWDLATKGIREGLTLANGDTISKAMLKEINGYNLKFFSDDTEMRSLAAELLFNDGEMTYDEAVQVRDNIMARKLPYVNMIEHYSARYVLNQNDIFSELVTEDGAGQWAKSEDRKKTESGNPAERTLTYKKEIKDKDGNTTQVDVTTTAKLLLEKDSIFHGPGAFKWVFDDGREIVINSKGQFETSAEFLGTYNFGGPKDAAHGIMDVYPYILWGNSPDDKTPFPSRVGATQTAEKVMNSLYNGAANIYRYYNSPDILNDFTRTVTKGYYPELKRSGRKPRSKL